MTNTLKVKAIATDVFHPHDDLHQFLTLHLQKNPPTDKSILAITSKIVSLSRGRLVKKTDVDKAELIRTEADHDLGEIGYGCHLTIKDGLFIPSAGIDESNSETGDYILFPKEPFQEAKRLHTFIKEHYALKNVGILITDSHTLPLRQGVTGIALSYWGFEGVKNMIGENDIFGRPLKMTKLDYADGLASASVMMMGEAAEQTPLALIEGAPVRFCDETIPAELMMPVNEDLYFPLYKDRLR